MSTDELEQSFNDEAIKEREKAFRQHSKNSKFLAVAIGKASKQHIDLMIDQLDAASEKSEALQSQLDAAIEKSAAFQTQLDAANKKSETLQTQLDATNKKFETLRLEVAALFEKHVPVEASAHEPGTSEDSESESQDGVIGTISRCVIL